MAEASNRRNMEIIALRGMATGNLRVGAGVGHGQQTGLSVLLLEVLISELLAVDGLATGALCRVLAWCAIDAFQKLGNIIRCHG